MADQPHIHVSRSRGARLTRQPQRPSFLAGKMPGGSLLLWRALTAVLLLSCPSISQGCRSLDGHLMSGQTGGDQGCRDGRGIARKVLLQAEPQPLPAAAPQGQDGVLTGTQGALNCSSPFNLHEITRKASQSMLFLYLGLLCSWRILASQTFACGGVATICACVRDMQ